MKKELISVLIPVRNEELFLESLLKSVTGFIIPDYSEIEVWIIDGMSSDKSLDIVRKFQKKFKFIKIFENSGVFQAHGLNSVLGSLECEWVLRLDAHTNYPSDYLLKCYQTAKLRKSDNCGGVINTYPGNNSYSASIVQAITTHKFGVGNSGFRTNLSEGLVDTVPFGFFKKEVFKKIGVFDERLIRAQDYEFNKRITQAGGAIWINPNIVANYYNQSSMGAFLKKQFFKEAPYNAYMWYLAPYTFAYRHAITGVFSAGIILGLVLSILFKWIYFTFITIMALYFVLAVISAYQQAKRYKMWTHVFILPWSFFLYHFIHGVGVLKGILLLLLRKAPVQKIKEPWNGYGRFRIKLGKVS